MTTPSWISGTRKAKKRRRIVRRKGKSDLTKAYLFPSATLKSTKDHKPE